MSNPSDTPVSSAELYRRIAEILDHDKGQDDLQAVLAEVAGPASP